MAKIKYSALVSDMRGKLNGSVASKNRFGSYFRNKVTPVNPETTFQQNARSRFGSLSSEFKSLTASAISAWNESAKNFPVTNIFGDQVFLTGQMLYNRLNGNLLKLSLPKVDTAPVPVSFPALQVQAVQADAGGGDITIFLLSPATIPANMDVVVYATRPLPRTRSFLKNEYRMVNNEQAPFVVDDNQVTITDAYNDRFGFAQAGDKIGVRIALVSKVNGQQSVPAEFITFAE